MSKKLINRIGEKYGYLIILSHSLKYRKLRYYLCRCTACNKLKFIGQSQIISGRSTSCGCKNLNQNRNKLENKKFGCLTIIKYLGWSKARGGQYECLCDCGNKCIRQYTEFTQRNCPISCGNCRKFKNGCRISNPQMAIFKMLNKGVLNFKSKSGYNIDIALVDSGRKIAIEYDCFVWHSKDKDNKKTNKLIEDGWNILRIRSAEKIPTVEQINLELLKLNSSNRLGVITLDDWEEREVYRR